MLPRGRPATEQRHARRVVVLVASIVALAPKMSCIPVATPMPVPSAAVANREEGAGTGPHAQRRFFSAPPPRYPFSNCAELWSAQQGILQCCNVLVIDGMPNHAKFPCARGLSFLVRQGTSSVSFQSSERIHSACGGGLLYSDLQWRGWFGWELTYVCNSTSNATWQRHVPVWEIGARTSHVVGDFTAKDVPLADWPDFAGSSGEGRCSGNNKTLVQGLVIEQTINKAFKLCEVEMLVAGVNVVPNNSRAVSSKFYDSSSTHYHELSYLTDGNIETWYAR